MAHVTMDTMTSSRIPIGLSLDIFASSNIVGVGQIFFNCNASKVVIVMIFIESPWSTKVFGIGILLI